MEQCVLNFLDERVSNQNATALLDAVAFNTKFLQKYDMQERHPNKKGVYILFWNDGTNYVGATENFKKRMSEWKYAHVSFVYFIPTYRIIGWSSGGWPIFDKKPDFDLEKKLINNLDGNINLTKYKNSRHYKAA